MYLATFTFTVAVLPVLLLCYYLIPAKGRSLFLLLCSLLIYGWGNPVRILYPLTYICYDFGVGLLLERLKGKKISSLLLLGFSAVVQTGVLVYIRSASAAGGLLFPFGIAVYTLQGLGYLIGIYRGRHPAALRFVPLALYLSFFPVLYAGPFISYPEFDEQLRHRSCNVNQLGEGLMRFIQGLAEKVVLADTFGYLFRELRQAQEMSMLTAWLTTVSFTMYLYFELLGYTEMARGLGCALGFTLPESFRHPFFTPSITAFMNGWNCTLTQWYQTNVREFLFRTEPKHRWESFAAQILTWTLIGAWYGRKPQFVLWGFAIGVLLTFEPLVDPLTKKRYVVGMLCTAVLLQFPWVLFFVDDLSEVSTIWKAMLGFGKGIADSYGFYFFTSYIALILLGFYIAADLFRNISERVSETTFGRFLSFWKPLAHGALLIFSLASMLYGERITGLWLQI